MSCPAQLHVLRLPENPFEKYKEDDEYQWLKYRWYLVAEEEVSSTKNETKSSSNQDKKNDDDGTKDTSNNDKPTTTKDTTTATTSSTATKSTTSAKKIQPGDVICFPILNTGAGEFECLRFVDTERRPDGKWLLLDGTGDIELPGFPHSIVEMVGGKEKLRDKYKKALDDMLERTASCTMEDVLGGDDEEFWEDPPMSDDTTTEYHETGEWTIPYQIDNEEH